jgi:hypothetical protein
LITTLHTLKAQLVLDLLGRQIAYEKWDDPPHVVDKNSVLDVDHFAFMNVLSNDYINDLPTS